MQLVSINFDILIIVVCNVVVAARKVTYEEVHIAFHVNTKVDQQNLNEQLYTLLPNQRDSIYDCYERFHAITEETPILPEASIPSRFAEFAYLGAIGWTQADGTVHWLCGGVLIWYNFLLTAAHCALGVDDQPPDIVRLGDRDLHGQEDDQHAQQFRIAEFIRHPEHRHASYYHDVALIRLERDIRLRFTVVPACLWTDYEEGQFQQFESAGWGRTGFAENHTAILMKAKLQFVDKGECMNIYTNNTIRKLKEGLKDYHICAVDRLMDTCEGDSGGPLQVNLLHNGRVSPFVVAITSFGLACGVATPGVYTKVAPYIDWIIDTMAAHSVDDDANKKILQLVSLHKHLFNATFCALRFVNYRERDRKHSTRMIKVEKMVPSYVAKLGWKVTEGQSNCYGIIIDENTVLTVANCTSYKGSPVSYITYLEHHMMNISKVYIHPKYRQGDDYNNNIAVLRLQHLLNFNIIRPACIRSMQPEHDTANVYGFGRRDINSDYYLFERTAMYIDPTLSYLKIATRLRNATTCKNTQLSAGSSCEQLCIGNNAFLVPQSCTLLTGGPIVGDKALSHLYPDVVGLVQFGNECGFGEHAVGTMLASHEDWLSSMLLPERQLKEGDTCTTDAGQDGRCAAVSVCQREWRKTNETAISCSREGVICCPLVDINSQMLSPKISTCSDRVQELAPKSIYGSLVVIIWTATKTKNPRCTGVIISAQIILTSANCIDSKSIDSVRSVAINQSYEVKQVIIHPAFNNTNSESDIAMLRLRDEISFTSHIFPTCLWTSMTSTPLILTQLSTSFQHSNWEISSEYVLTMYNSDCQRTHPHEVLDSQLCAKNPTENSTCVSLTDHLTWTDEHGVPYLIGMSTELKGCDNWYYMIHTRISAYVGWINIHIE